MTFECRRQSLLLKFEQFLCKILLNEKLVYKTYWQKLKQKEKGTYKKFFENIFHSINAEMIFSCRKRQIFHVLIKVKAEMIYSRRANQSLLLKNFFTKSCQTKHWYRIQLDKSQRRNDILMWKQTKFSFEKFFYQILSNI